MRITVIVHDDDDDSDDSDDDDDRMSSTLFKVRTCGDRRAIIFYGEIKGLVIPGNYRVKACQSVYLSACNTQTEQNDKSLILLIILLK